MSQEEFVEAIASHNDTVLEKTFATIEVLREWALGAHMNAGDRKKVVEDEEGYRTALSALSTEEISALETMMQRVCLNCFNFNPEEKTKKPLRPEEFENLDIWFLEFESGEVSYVTQELWELTYRFDAKDFDLPHHAGYEATDRVLEQFNTSLRKEEAELRKVSEESSQEPIKSHVRPIHELRRNFPVTLAWLWYALKNVKLPVVPEPVEESTPSSVPESPESSSGSQRVRSKFVREEASSGSESSSSGSASQPPERIVDKRPRKPKRKLKEVKSAEIIKQKPFLTAEIINELVGPSQGEGKGFPQMALELVEKNPTDLTADLELLTFFSIMHDIENLKEKGTTQIERGKFWATLEKYPAKMERIKTFRKMFINFFSPDAGRSYMGILPSFWSPPPSEKFQPNLYHRTTELTGVDEMLEGSMDGVLAYFQAIVLHPLTFGPGDEKTGYSFFSKAMKTDPSKFMIKFDEIEATMKRLEKKPASMDVAYRKQSISQHLKLVGTEDFDTLADYMFAMRYFELGILPSGKKKVTTLFSQTLKDCRFSLSIKKLFEKLKVDDPSEKGWKPWTTGERSPVAQPIKQAFMDACMKLVQPVAVLEPSSSSSADQYIQSIDEADAPITSFAPLDLSSQDVEESDIGEESEGTQPMETAGPIEVVGLPVHAGAPQTTGSQPGTAASPSLGELPHWKHIIDGQYCKILKKAVDFIYEKMGVNVGDLNELFKNKDNYINPAPGYTAEEIKTHHAAWTPERARTESRDELIKYARMLAGSPHTDPKVTLPDDDASFAYNFLRLYTPSEKAAPPSSAIELLKIAHRLLNPPENLIKEVDFHSDVNMTLAFHDKNYLARLEYCGDSNEELYNWMLSIYEKTSSAQMWCLLALWIAVGPQMRRFALQNPIIAVANFLIRKALLETGAKLSQTEQDDMWPLRTAPFMSIELYWDKK